MPRSDCSVMANTRLSASIDDAIRSQRWRIDVCPMGQVERGNRVSSPAVRDLCRHWIASLPTFEKFPRSQRFLLGDRIQTSALDVLEHLIPQILWGDLARVASIARKPQTIKHG